MQENHPRTAVVGPLVGLALLVIAIVAAINYLQQGVAELQAQTVSTAAASAPTASQPLSDGASSAPPAAEGTTAPATAVPAAIAATATVTDSVVSVATPAASQTAEDTTASATAVPAAVAAMTVTASVASVAPPAASQAPAPDTQTAAPPSASADVLAVISKAGCAACHTIPGVAGAVGQLGPDLANIGVDGATRRPDFTAADYISESIRTPNAFLVPECPIGPCLANIMPQTFSQTLTEQEIATLVDYLTTLKSSQ
ncbi:MAG: c-type cytochrome [Chloroflexi bacterium]|nr:c-type cytochrome [Chloroflexota bacterium]